MQKIDKLLKEIELLRDKMIQITLKKGFTCDEAIIISQKLDRLMNSYQKEKFKKTCTEKLRE